MNEGIKVIILEDTRTTNLGPNSVYNVILNITPECRNDFNDKQDLLKELISNKIKEEFIKVL